MSRGKAAVRYVRTHLDEALIIGALGKMAFSGMAGLSDSEQAVLAALRRSSTELQDASPEAISEYLSAMSEESLPGLVSNVKGILHEMQFVALENEDGDSVYASIFDATNHPGTDVQFTDADTGATWEVQLKATDNADYAREWVAENPDGNILVTSELAERTELESSGFSNETLTSDVKGVVDKMIAGDESIWDFFPMITVLALAPIIWELWSRYRNWEIDLPTFKHLAIRATGLKAAKIALLSAMLAIPVIGQATGAILIAKFLLGARNAMAGQSGYSRQPAHPQALLAKP